MVVQETELVDFPCPICENVDYDVIHPDTLDNCLPEFGYDFNSRHSDHYRIIRCQSCSHGYCSPRPADLYRSYIDVEDSEYLKNTTQRLETASLVIETIRKIKLSGRLLDIGPATGDFLSIAKKYYDSDGLELSKWAANIAVKKGHTIHSCRLSELVTNTDYDIITMWGVIEHFEFPKDEIIEIKRILAADGIVCFWTGDIDSWLARLLGSKWWYIQGQHIQYFSQRSLDKLFDEQGFKRIYTARYPYVMSLESMAKSLGRYPFIGPLANAIFSNSLFGKWTITFRLPGELFAIYQKQVNQ